MQQGPKGKKGKKKKKNVGVGDTGAARLNEECCAVRELVGRSELDFDENLMRNISILSKNAKKSAPGACGGPGPPAAPAAGRWGIRPRPRLHPSYAPRPEPEPGLTAI